METEPRLQTEASALKALTQRYRLSWIDWLLMQISRLPGPSWLFYLFLLILLMLVNNALHWIEGTVPTGTFDPARTMDMFFPVYFLAFTHYLNRCARRALENFRPVTNLSDADYEELAYELQTVPAWPALVAGIVGIIFALYALQADPAAFGIFATSSLATTLFIEFFSMFWGATLLVFIVHTVRQLNLVNRIYRRATRIDLFNLKPVYAFSALTARAGIGLIFFLYFVVAISSGGKTPATDELSFAPSENLSLSVDALGLVLIGALLLPGIAAFILPLQGIHRRLVAEKESKISATHNYLTNTLGKLHKEVDSDNFERMGGIHNALSSLKLEREELEKISTWPWETGTLSGFVTAILIPILLWLLTRLLERVI